MFYTAKNGTACCKLVLVTWLRPPSISVHRHDAPVQRCLLAAHPLRRMVRRLLSGVSISLLDSDQHRTRSDHSFHRERGHGIPRPVP